MKNNFIFNNVTSNHPHQFTAGNTKMGYRALGFKELGASVTAINSISSCTKGNCDEIGISEKGIEYITFSAHNDFLEVLYDYGYITYKEYKRIY